MTGSLEDRVAEILTRYSMIPAGARVGVAVSGGADSMVLLHVLHRLRSRFGAELTVLHLNHQLRGAESDADEEFVREQARVLGHPCFTGRTQLPPGNLEQEARDARRAFFARLRNELHLDRVALGHNRSDQAETVLYRVLRGSGTAGVAGMRPVTADGLIRPLLCVSRNEARDWARAEGIPWREDATNSDARFVRNRLRNEAIPALSEAFNSNLEGVLAGMASVAQDEEDYWDSIVSAAYERFAKRSQLGLFLQVAELKGLHTALRRRIVRRAIQEIRGDLRSIDLHHVEAILALIRTSEGHDRVIIPGVDALRSFGTLLLAQPGKINEGKRHYRVELRPGERAQLPFNLGEILLQNCAKFEKGQSPSTEIAYIDSDALRGPVHVRNWEPGDAMRMPGHASVQKLKTLFQECHILLWERRHWPVAVSGDEVVWARQFGVSADFAAGPDAQTVLRLTYDSGRGV